MNNKLINKHEKELQCFQQAVKIALKKQGETRRLMKYLDGKDVFRREEERPDIVKLCSKQQKNVLVGIEHFRVDHLSIKKKDNKIASTGVVAEKEVESIYQKWHEEVMKTGNVPTEAVEAIANGIATQMQRTETASYHTYIDAFNYSLEQHLKSVDDYRKNLLTLSDKKYKIELAFLIEIHMEFNNLYLNDKNGNIKSSQGKFPIFEEIVQILEKKIDYRKINYVILIFGNTLYNEKIKVIAIRTNNIRKNLECQGEKIYEYAGDDMLLFDFQTSHRNINIISKCIFEEDKINIGYQYTAEVLDDKILFGFLQYAFKRAFELKKNRYNFATTVSVQMLMECLEDFIVGWNLPNNNKREWYPKPIFTLNAFDDLEKRLNDFEKRWFPEAGR